MIDPKDAARYLRGRYGGGNAHGIIGFSFDDADQVRQFSDAVQKRLFQVSNPTMEQWREVALDVAESLGIRIGIDAQPWKLPEPWRTYFTACAHTRYLAGHIGGRPFVGTQAWILFTTDDILKTALDAGFIRFELPADGVGAQHGSQFPIDLPRPGVEDDAVVEVGGVTFLRSVLAPLVLQGATHGHVGPGPQDPLHAPGIGVAKAFVVGSSTDMDS